MDLRDRLTELAARGIEGVIPLVEEILQEGILRGASDIHIEPAPDALLIRYRLDGVLHPAVEVPCRNAANAVSRVKVLADLLTYQSDVPQEGRINREKLDAPTDLRVSTFPTVRGEKAVVRLFDPATRDVRLEQLGYPKAVRRAIEHSLAMPKGVIFLTGPAGSGKTTTIYAALRHILEHSRGERHIVTVEDPVERILPGVTQTQIHPPSGLTFARCLRSLMRQDPEVILVGEVRDRETAEIAVEAGLTGHLVISTIHSGTVAGVYSRLLDMRVPPHLIASSVSFVAAQRLVRKLCPACRKPVEDPAQLRCLPGDLAGKAYVAAGCNNCFDTGYSGRTVIVEAAEMSSALHQKILASAASEEMESAAVSLGMMPLHEAAVAAVRDGITSPDEVVRVLGPERSEENA
jgi:type II secretory ATPase GspE/PulE/Tfp pilus assembly ATPase PilB-like protein